LSTEKINADREISKKEVKKDAVNGGAKELF
jgi:hypothetical protein